MVLPRQEIGWFRSGALALSAEEDCASKRAYLGRYWTGWGVLRPAICMNKIHKSIHAIIGPHRCCESSTAVAIAAEVRRRCEKCLGALRGGVGAPRRRFPARWVVDNPNPMLKLSFVSN